MAMSRIIFEKWLTMTRIALNPLDSGKPVMRLMEICSQDREGTLWGWRGLQGFSL